MKVVITAGGTGGHIFPALAVIEKLQKEDKTLELLYIGTTDRMEKDLIPKKNIPYVGLKMLGLNRHNPFKNIEVMKTYYRAVKKAKEELQKFKPDIVIFYTGPGENSYYRYITEESNFTLDGEPEQLGSLDKYDVVKLPIKEVGLAYKTWHPARMNKELREQVYETILADIKENIDKLLKKE